MKTSFKIAEVAGISINLHITFFLLIFLFGRFFYLALILFFFVTVHELAHSLVAKRFGIQVKEITLLPIGGIASLTGMPKKPAHELLISIAGPLTNVAVVVLFYIPLRLFMGPDFFHSSFRAFFTGGLPMQGGKALLAWVYWMNLMLAAFNLIPAFPMDGGRILRALLTERFGLRQATKVAVNIGIGFAILLAYFGLTQGSILTIVIALFIFIAASSEEMQVNVRETIRNFRVRDILSHDFMTVSPDALLSDVLEIMFKNRQEDFPVMDDARTSMQGFITRNDVISGIHQFGVSAKVSSIMRTDIPPVNEGMTLDEVQSAMQSSGTSALPVVRGREVTGIVTIEGINKVYMMMMARPR